MNHNRLFLVVPFFSILFLCFLIFFLRNNPSTDSLLKPMNTNELSKISYKEALDVLDKIKNQKEIPDSQIDNAVIIIRDDSYITAEIKCDTLVKYDKLPTLLIGNIVATFYDSIGPLSVLRSDFAEYAENDSLVAKRNITMYNLRMKDSLFFVDQDAAQVVWDRYYSKIISNNDFILKDSTSRCTKGSKFQSNLDLSEIKIENSKGANDCR